MGPVTWETSSMESVVKEKKKGQYKVLMVLLHCTEVCHWSSKMKKKPGRGGLEDASTGGNC